MIFKNDLENFFFTKDNKSFPVFKWHHYFEIYHRHLAKFRGKNPNVLEIGVGSGGSLEMWKDYFGDGANIFGIDNRLECLEVAKKIGQESINIHIGDQSDPEFWRDYILEAPTFDVIIDDGGHLMNQQIESFKCLYYKLADNGVYLVEDTHTSYFDNEEFQGGVGKNNTFIEFAKKFIDDLHSYHFEEDQQSSRLKFRNITNSIHFYDSIVIFEKLVCKEKPIATKR